MAKSIPGQSNLFSPPTCEASPSATSLPALADGPMPSDWPTGTNPGPSGRDPVPVSRGAKRGGALGPRIPVIFGQRGAASSCSAALGVSLGNRLRALTDGRGSMLFSMTWKERTTPSGRVICQLVVLVRRFAGRASGSLPTPVARDYRNGLHSPTALARRARHSRGVNLNEYMERTLGHGGTLNPLFVCLLMGYPASVDGCADTVTASFPKSRKRSSKRMWRRWAADRVER